MKILLITQWYKPVISAPAKRTSKMAQILAQAGHRVTVLTGFPSYPSGILPQKYVGKLWAWEKDGPIKILRVWEIPTTPKGLVRRLFNMFSFVLSACTAAIILPVFDKVIVSSPSFLSGLAGLCSARELKSQFYFDVRDLWPDVTIPLGIFKEGLFYQLLRQLEHYFYRRAEKILVATPAIKRHLFLEGFDQNKIVVLLNSVDTILFKPRTMKRPDNFCDDDFLVTFIGNHSRLYDLENVVEAAEILPKNKIKFLLVGEGESKADLEKLVARKKLPNIIFEDEKPAAEIAQILAMSNLGLISLNETKIAQETIPSKLGEYLATGLPIVAAIGAEAKKMIEQNQVGLIYTAGDPQALAQAILKLYRDHKLRQKMGINARKLALKTFSDKNFGQTLHQIFS